jgi:hypothetical protein
MSFKSLVKKLMKEGKSKEAATKIAGSVANAKMKGAGSGPTAKQKARIKKSPAKMKNKVKGADMNVPAEKLKYIQKSDSPAKMNKYDKDMMHERELIYDAKKAIHRIDKQKHKYDNVPTKMYGKSPMEMYGKSPSKKHGAMKGDQSKTKMDYANYKGTDKGYKGKTGASHGDQSATRRDYMGGSSLSKHMKSN